MASYLGVILFLIKAWRGWLSSFHPTQGEVNTVLGVCPQGANHEFQHRTRRPTPHLGANVRKRRRGRKWRGREGGRSSCLTDKNRRWACSHCARWSVRDPFTARKWSRLISPGSERVLIRKMDDTKLNMMNQFRSTQHYTFLHWTFECLWATTMMMIMQSKSALVG